MIRDISTPQEYIQYRSKPDPKEKLVINKLYGRLVKGNEDKHFEKLCTEDWKQLAWVFGPETLSDFIQYDDDKLADKLGLLKEWIKGYLVKGYKFRLLIFNSEIDSVLANWDNSFLLFEKYYPLIYPKLSRWKETLMNTPWSYFEVNAPFNWLEISRKGRSDPYHMTYDKLQHSEGTLLEVRAFLYFEIGMKELYRGDGWTYSVDGARGYPEYFTFNHPLSEFKSYSFQDLKFSFV